MKTAEYAKASNPLSFKFGWLQAVAVISAVLLSPLWNYYIEPTDAVVACVAAIISTIANLFFVIINRKRIRFRFVAITSSILAALATAYYSIAWVYSGIVVGVSTFGVTPLVSIPLGLYVLALSVQAMGLQRRGIVSSAVFVSFLSLVYLASISAP